MLDKKHKKGYLNHLRAIEWLTSKEYYVFDNVSGLGPCDLIALKDDGETLKEISVEELMVETGATCPVSTALAVADELV